MASRTRTTRKWHGAKWCRPTTRLAVYARDGFACVYCCVGAERGQALTLDHVKSIEKGGTNHPSNLVTACFSCNSRKQDLSMAAWLRTLAAAGHDPKVIVRRVRNATARVLDRAAGAVLRSRRRP